MTLDLSDLNINPTGALASLAQPTPPKAPPKVLVTFEYRATTASGAARRQCAALELLDPLVSRGVLPVYIPFWDMYLDRQYMLQQLAKVLPLMDAVFCVHDETSFHRDGPPRLDFGALPRFSDDADSYHGWEYELGKWLRARATGLEGFTLACLVNNADT